MSRYYYTDPLAAAWMAKHFGMKLEAEYFDDEKAEYELSDDVFDFVHMDYSGCDTMEDVLEVGGTRKIYIHPDSLPMLEPAKGDLIHIVRGFCSCHKVVDDVARGSRRKGVTGVWSAGEHWDITSKEPLHDWEIILRNGIAFHWPEVEA
jgi:hypothetical protein